MRQFSCLLSLFAAPLAAQTFIVDANGGPGTNYTSIAAAVAAVPSGATLLVRPGTYAEFAIQQKALTVLGGPGVVVNPVAALVPSIDVRYLAGNQAVAIRGFELVGCPGTVTVTQCQGPVLLEDIAHTGTCIIPSSPGATFGVTSSAQVIVRNGTGYDSSCSNSTVVFEGCSLQGKNAYFVFGNTGLSSPAMTVAGGSVQLVDCTLVGGAGHPFVPSPWGPNRPGLELAGGAAARVLAPGSITAGVGLSTMPAAPAIDGTGSLRIDPGVTLTTGASPPIGATLAAQTQTLPMPTVLGTSASPGGTLSADALGPVGSTVILVVGLPGAPVAIAGFQDPFWVEPAAYAFVGIGTPQPGVPVTYSVPVPNQAWTLGLRFAWQSAALTPSGLQASNPTLTLVR